MCRFKQGSAGTRANRAFAGMCPGNPYSTRALDLLPVAAVICLHCALSASAFARGGLNVCGVRTSADSCPSTAAARKPASFGHFRQGGAEFRANWAFAGRPAGNPGKYWACGQAIRKPA